MIHRLLLVGVVLLSGCISVPDSKDPVFYGITALNHSEIQPIQLSSDFAVAVSDVNLPEYLNRPQIVTQDKDNQMRFAQFHRWAEPLDKNLTRVIKENVAQILPRAHIISYPLDFPLEAVFRIDIEVTRFEIDISGDLYIALHWTIVDVGYPKNTVMKRSEFRLPIENQSYTGAAQTVSSACALLSGEIAQEIFKMSEIGHP